jgi:hypothetical protein
LHSRSSGSPARLATIREDLVQGLGEPAGLAAEAAVVAGEGHRRRAEPLGQRFIPASTPCAR